MASAEDGLGTADGGCIGEETQVACQAEAPGVGQPLAIGKDEVGRGDQPLQGTQDQWCLTEREEARNVRKARLPLDPLDFNDLEVRQAHDHGGPPRNAAGIGRRDIGACNVMGLFRNGVGQGDLRSQARLDVSRLLQGDLPRVEPLDVHGEIIARPATARIGIRPTAKGFLSRREVAGTSVAFFLLLFSIEGFRAPVGEELKRP